MAMHNYVDVAKLQMRNRGFEISLPEIQQVNYGHLLLVLIITALHYGATMCMHYYIYIMQI